MIRISLTSWKGRINTVYKTIESLVCQTVPANSIELNLSIVEFPNKEMDLPESLMKYSDRININWVEGNTRTFKKIIPTLQKYYGEEYYLFSVDDDFTYRKDYISMMIEYIEKYKADSFCLSNSNVIGNRQIYKSLAFSKDFWEKLTNGVIQYGIDDSYIEYYLKMHNKVMAKYRPNDILKIIQQHDEVLPLHDEYRKNNRVQKAINEISKIKF